MDNRTALLAFSAAPGLGIRRISNLIRIAGNAIDAWNANQQMFKQLEMGGKIYETFYNFRKKFDLQNYLKQMADKHVDFLTIKDSDYPELLKQTPEPPLVLYLKGNKELLQIDNGKSKIDDRLLKIESRELINDLSSTLNFQPSSSIVNHQSSSSPTLAVVGTRKTSSYGREVTQKIVKELAESGMTIVSGLALGIDAIAHQTALHAFGKTIAVLGCGVNCCYPRENQNIYDQMTQQGSLIISEYPLSQPANQGTFPARNRIVAGLSLGVLVTEAATDSGSLITADYAKKFGRPVFAVPGPITSAGAAGTTYLLKHGATLITTGDEIIQALNIKSENKYEKIFQNLNSDEQKIVEMLQLEPLTIDDISNQTNFSIPQLMSILTTLELKGIIHNIGNQEYSLK